MTRVFISYSRKDISFVERLAKDLTGAGLKVWYDLSGLDGGARWGVEIQNAIQQCQIFIVILSPNSIGSEWVEKEFMYANSLKRKIIPLLYRTCEIPMWFINLHFIDVQGDNYDSHFWVILKAMGVTAENLEVKKGSAEDTNKDKKPAVEVTRPPPVAGPVEKDSVPASPEPQVGSEEKPGKKTFPREFRLRPAWVIGIVILLGLVAFGIWGVPQLAARFAPAPTPAPTQTATATIAPTISPKATIIATSTLTPIPTLGIGSTMIRQADGMEMVYVPAGNFTMGEGTLAPSMDFIDNGGHQVYLHAFWIDKTLVTNAMYAVCVQDGACKPPQATNSMTRSSYYGNSQYNNYPVIFVDWFRAADYCHWAGAYLPSEAEWEFAARGADGRLLPWGTNYMNANLLNYGGNIGDTSEVNKYPDGSSPYGVLDMLGNVNEWTSDWYDHFYYSVSPEQNPQGPGSGQYRVIRGGSWVADPNGNYPKATTRMWSDPNVGTVSIGFRCDRPAP